MIVTREKTKPSVMTETDERVAHNLQVDWRRGEMKTLHSCCDYTCLNAIAACLSALSAVTRVHR